MTEAAGISCPVHFLKDLDFKSLVEPDPCSSNFSATKVICTLGPACRSVHILEELLLGGMTAARVDLTWGSVEYHLQSLRNLAQAMRRTKRLCATILDTVGREIMVRSSFTLNEDGWAIHNVDVPIEAGQEVRLTPRDVPISSNVLPVTYPMLAEIAEHGDTFFVGRYLASGADDGSVYLEVNRVDGDDVICEARNSTQLSGLLTVMHSGSSERGGNSSYIDLPLLSEHDVAAIRHISREFPDLDFVSLTFTRSGEDVSDARALLSEMGMDTVKVLAKVEDAAGLHAFEEISDAADGIIISRGNLGLTGVPPEKMARVQKAIISACNLKGQPVILTRIVDTVANSPRPTRAEATDVANAVLDGVDALMLGAETLRGKFPLQTVTTLVSICTQAERVFDHETHFDRLINTAMQKTGEEMADHPGLYLGSPDESLATLHSEMAPKQQSMMHHGLPSVMSTSHLARQQARGAASSRSMSGLMAAEARRLSRLDSVASTAVRAAAKINAGLIIVYAHSGRTASMVAKYRPPMPVVSLMVPRVIQRDMRWHMSGLSAARQTLITRGVIPLLGAPMPGSSESLLQEAIRSAVARGLVAATAHVVCVLSAKETLVVQVVSAKDYCGDDFSLSGVDEQPEALPHVEPPGFVPAGNGDDARRAFRRSSSSFRRASAVGAALPHESPLHIVGEDDDQIQRHALTGPQSAALGPDKL